MKTLFNSFSSARHQAFTKLELVVVILVTAMLGGIVASAIRGAKNQTKIAQCAGNLRQFALSQLVYANDYTDKLPASSGSGSWSWDLNWNVGNMLNQYGASPEIMYCPGTAPRFQPANNEELYEYYAPGSIHVIGYVPTLPGTVNLPATNVNSQVTPQPIQNGAVTLPPPAASQRVLIADANITHTGTTNFYIVPGGYRIFHMSPHLNGLFPAGGNLAMLDGHVEWRPFSQMQLRTVSTGASVIYFW
jgi:prepilin-type processing-associated H-X9-DG protein